MKWYEVTVYTTDEGADIVCSALQDCGMEGFSVEESKEKAASVLQSSVPFWDFADMENIGTATPCVKTYLEVKPESLSVIEEAKVQLKKLKESDPKRKFGSLDIDVNEVDDQDWANNWKKYYKPIEVGGRLLILPSWEEEPNTKRKILKLDPGMAFGSGSHQTTRMCLEFLDDYVEPGMKVLDLGCGSGILSIASMLLGAESAKAVDIDPVALNVVKENAQLNDIDMDKFHVYIGDVNEDKKVRENISGTYDIVVANIVADVIIKLAPLAMDYCKSGTLFIVSGIINERLEEVEAALKKAGFVIREKENMDDWNAICSIAP